MEYTEDFLHQPFKELGFSKEFCAVTEHLGYFTLADLLKQTPEYLSTLPGFDRRLKLEYISYLQQKGVSHYLD
ncbi:hypothetical protein SAMN05216436_105121 [bacterium A37T11]|nr:hypothetical protein SAMN05216436_105121 [bacterium A37T11]